MRNDLWKVTLRFWRSETGNIALAAALALPALMVVFGGAADFANLIRVRSEVQSAADAAALAAANQFAVFGSKDTQVKAAARSAAEANIDTGNGEHAMTVTIDRKAAKVTVKLEQRWTPFFAQFIDQSVTPVRTTATASYVGASNICVLALAPSGLTGLHLNLFAKVEAHDCDVYSNTRSLAGVRLDVQARLNAKLICSAGGVVGLLSNMTPSPVTDCPPVKDPLAARRQPSVGGCDETSKAVSSGSVTLHPGVYCGGLRISGKARVSFAPGLYVVKDGCLTIRDKAEVEGRNVGFFLTGTDAVLEFRDTSRVRLSGAEDGAMAGILFFEDRSAPRGRLHLIRNTRSEELTGTIYLPRGTLVVDPNATVAQESAYTAIIADRMSMTEGPTLVLKSDYEATKVPVPDGIRSSAQVFLTE